MRRHLPLSGRHSTKKFIKLARLWARQKGRCGQKSHRLAGIREKTGIAFHKLVESALRLAKVRAVYMKVSGLIEGYKQVVRRLATYVFRSDKNLGQAGRIQLMWRSPRDPLPIH